MASVPPNGAGRVFISYRREETAYPAGWLFDRLTDRFGQSQIFKDIDSIEPGDDFVQRITDAVGSCDVLLALIGDEWLTVAHAGGQRRLDDENDFVRLEIEAALSRKVRVIPILVEGARMPRADELPPSLAGLVRRQALELSPGRFAADLDRLLRVLDKTLAETTEARAPTAPPVVTAPARAAPVPEAVPENPDRSRRGLSDRVRSVLSTRARVVAAVVVVVILLFTVVALSSGGTSPSGDESPSSEEGPPPDEGAWPAPSGVYIASFFSSFSATTSVM